MFDTVPISVVTYLKSEAKSVECRRQKVSTVDEKRSLVDRVFFCKFMHKQQRSFGRAGLKQPYMEKLVRGRVNGGVQPPAGGHRPESPFRRPRCDSEPCRMPAVDRLCIPSRGSP